MCVQDIEAEHQEKKTKQESILIAGTIFFSRPFSYRYINSCLYTMTQIPDTTERA
jgi:hypothetical protein